MLPAIEQLRTLADQSGAALLTEGPVHPDHELLRVCSEALHALRQAAAIHAANRDGAIGDWTREGFVHSAWYVEWDAHLNRSKQALRAAGKISATTPAGIYAKAMLVRMSPSGSPKLAASLADELIQCAELRRTLWPAGRV
jgi:hypothetical protein